MKTQLNILIEQKDLDLLKKISEKRGQRHTDFAILAIREKMARLGFLSIQETKALEVMPNER